MSTSEQPWKNPERRKTTMEREKLQQREKMSVCIKRTTNILFYFLVHSNELRRNWQYFTLYTNTITNICISIFMCMYIFLHVHMYTLYNKTHIVCIYVYVCHENVWDVFFRKKKEFQNNYFRIYTVKEKGSRSRAILPGPGALQQCLGYYFSNNSLKSFPDPGFLSTTLYVHTYIYMEYTDCIDKHCNISKIFCSHFNILLYSLFFQYSYSMHKTVVLFTGTIMQL